MTIEVFETLIRKLERSTPATVMASLITEQAFSAPALDELFEASADRQYTRELLFSLMVKLMLSVVTGTNPSINQAIERNREEIHASKKAVYEKLAHMEPGVSEQLVMHVAHRCTELVEAMPGRCCRQFLERFQRSLSMETRLQPASVDSLSHANAPLDRCPEKPWC